ANNASAMNLENRGNQYLSSAKTTPGKNHANINAMAATRPSSPELPGGLSRGASGVALLIAPLLRPKKTLEPELNNGADRKQNDDPCKQRVAQQLLHDAVRGADDTAAADAARELTESAQDNDHERLDNVIRAHGVLNAKLVRQN